MPSNLDKQILDYLAANPGKLAREIGDAVGQDKKAIKQVLKDFAEGDHVAKAVTDQVAAVVMMIIMTSINTAVMNSAMSAGR